MPYCPKCGKQVSETDAFCLNCGERLKPVETAPVPPAAPRIGWTPSGAPPPVEGAIGHLNLALNLATSQPMIFVPALLGGIISDVLSFISRQLLGPFAWLSWWAYPQAFGAYMVYILLSGLISLIGAIISYILFFASLDMSRDAYLKTPLNLSESMSYVVSRIGVFIVASIAGAILSLTIILIPAVILMFVIMIVDEAGIAASLSKAFNVLGRDLGDVLILIAIGIIGGLILAFIPFIGGLLATCLNVVIGLAFIDVYYNYKRT